MYFGNFFNQFIGASQHTTDYVLNSRNASFTAQMEYIMGNPTAIGTLMLFAVKSVFEVFVVKVVHRDEVAVEHEVVAAEVCRVAFGFGVFGAGKEVEVEVFVYVPVVVGEELCGGAFGARG